jgi:predicted metal-dependent hydrolase
MPQIELGNISIKVEQKDIKNIHLSVYPPNGTVKISAPLKMDLDTIRVFAISKLQWIKKQQAEFKNQERETPREYLTKESHYFQGKRYLLKVIENKSLPKIELTHNEIKLFLRPNTTVAKRKDLLDEWYRSELKKIIPSLTSKWEKKIGVAPAKIDIRKMRTKWGSCSIETKVIRLNLELAKKPIECLEYIIVHELIHLIERSHNERFKNLMNKFMPKWRFHRDELNRLPFSHTDWKY